MLDIKIRYVHQNFWCGILVCLIVVCPFLAPAEEHDMQSEPQQTTDKQNQSPPQMTRQGIQEIIAPLIRGQKTLETYTLTVIESQETLKAHTTRYTVILGILLVVILSAFTWLFLRYRHLNSQVNDIRERIGTFSNANSSLRQDLPDIRNRIQKLEIQNQKSTQEILNLLKPMADKSTNEVPSPSHKKFEPSEQIIADTSAPELTPAFTELCERYNAGIQDKSKRNDFLQHYHNSYKIHVENASDRRINPQTGPIFKTHHAAGNFWGCHIEEEKLYLVVPAYQLGIVHAILRQGAFVDVFECGEQEFDDPDGCYKVVRVIKPAIFEPDDAKETWTLKEKGRLELQTV